MVTGIGCDVSAPSSGKNEPAITSNHILIQGYGHRNGPMGPFRQTRHP